MSSQITHNVRIGSGAEAGPEPYTGPSVSAPTADLLKSCKGWLEGVDAGRAQIQILKMSRGWSGKAFSRALLSLAVATPLMVSCATATGTARARVDDAASAKVLLENVYSGVFVLTASSCRSKRREYQIELISREVSELSDLYERKFGVRPKEEMILIEGDGCMGYYGRNLRATLGELERARNFLNAD